MKLETVALWVIGAFACLYGLFLLISGLAVGWYGLPFLILLVVGIYFLFQVYKERRLSAEDDYYDKVEK